MMDEERMRRIGLARRREEFVVKAGAVLLILVLASIVAGVLAVYGNWAYGDWACAFKKCVVVK